MKIKIDLANLKVQSFVTTFDKASTNTAKGGNTTDYPSVGYGCVTVDTLCCETADTVCCEDGLTLPILISI